MKPPSVARAVYANMFFDQLESTGYPVERHMGRHKLPDTLRERPDALVPNIQLFGFLQEAERHIDAGCLVYRSVRDMGRRDFSVPLQQRLDQAPTLWMMLKAYVECCRIENAQQSFWIVPTRRNILITSQPTLGRLQSYSNWVQNYSLISLVREFVGPEWTPAEFAFMCDTVLCDEIRTDFSDTRFLMGQAMSWISIPRGVLGNRRIVTEQALSTPAAAPSVETQLDLVRLVRRLLHGHLGTSTEELDVIAECLDMSGRSLQRALSDQGTSFRVLQQNERVEEAQRLLADPDARIIDVSVAVGYNDTSNFTRFFRNACGLTPTEYRLAHAAPVPGSPPV